MRSLRVVLAVHSLALAACEPRWPGESVGSFDVVGTVREHGCGPSAVPVIDPLRFPVELRADRGGLVYWRRLRAPLVQGTRSASGEYRFEAIGSVMVIEPSPDEGVVGCALDQHEVIAVEVESADPTDAGPTEPDAGAAPAPLRLEGEHRITYTPVAGSDCTPLLAAGGGAFLALPCEVTYELAGTERDPL